MHFTSRIMLVNVTFQIGSCFRKATYMCHCVTISMNVTLDMLTFDFADPPPLEPPTELLRIIVHSAGARPA